MPGLWALLLVTAGAAPSAPRARALAAHEQWDVLLLEFSKVRTAQVSSRESEAIARALLSGCIALSGREWALANGLAEKSVAWHPTPEAIACLSDSAVATGQSGGAEDALEAGVRRFPRDAGLRVRLGRLLLSENDGASAIAVLRPVRSGREVVEARVLLARARALERAEAARSKRPLRGPGSVRSTSLTYSSGEGPDGLRTRTNARFAIKYSAHQRDFAQRSEYEGQVLAALEEAHDFAERSLGRARQSRVDVVLYSREEFTLHFGLAPAAFIAGLYDQSAIRINNAAQWTSENKATLVHEYVHSAIDEVAGFQMKRIPVWLNEGIAEYVEWRYLGFDHPPLAQLAALRAQALQHRLASLRSLSSKALVASADPGLSYAESGVAVELLLRRGGAEALLAFIQHLGRAEGSEAFEKTLQADYDVSLDALQRDLEGELARR